MEKFCLGGDRKELVAVLLAYEMMMRLCWPEVHLSLGKRKSIWGPLEPNALMAEITSLMQESDASPVGLRVFWKRTPEFTFWGGNMHFLKDSGLPTMQSVLGLTDFSKEVPWNRQAPLYRKDDEEVVNGNREKLNIVQRQDQTTDTIYLHAAKVPIRVTNTQVIGLMGAYTLIDAVKAARLIHRG